jgi:hypothetical protein
LLRRFVPVFSFVGLLGLFVYLFWVPLRPVAWGGPRGQGPFEEGDLPTVGRWARDARVPLETFAAWRSPERPLDATAEMFAGVHALLAAGRFGVLWIILYRLSGRKCLATLGVLMAATPMFFGVPRQTDADVGLLLFVLLMAATTVPRVPWLVALVGLPALFAFWVNAHASALPGLGWLTVVMAGRAVEWWKGSSDRPTVGRLFLALVLCVAATCLNPDGPRYFVDAIRMTKNPNVPSLPDWQPLDFSKPGWLPWAFLGTLVLLVLTQVFSRRVLGPTLLFVVLSFGFWPVLQQRGMAYWWLIAPWLIVSLLRRPEPEAQREGDGESGPTPSPSRCASGSGLWKWLLCASVLIAVVSTPFVRWLVIGKPRSLQSSVSADTPWRVARELTAGDDDAGAYLPGLHETVRATYPNGHYRGAILTGVDQGDFLAWVLDGDNNQPVMIYTRPETLDPPHWGECQRALEGTSDWWEILGRHQVNLIVIDPRRHGPLAERLTRSANWRIVEGDVNAALLVAVRRGPKLPVELQP